MLADQQPPLSHDLGRLQILAGARLPEELLDLQDFAVKARYSPDEQLRGELEARLDAMGAPVETNNLLHQQGQSR